MGAGESTVMDVEFVVQQDIDEATVRASFSSGAPCRDNALWSS